MNAYIISFNRFTYLKGVLPHLERFGLTPIIVDNASTYPPLLEWYESCPYHIERLEFNLGHLAPWTSGVVQRYGEPRYVVTDPDLDLSKVPSDVVEKMHDGLNRFPDRKKCGVSLEINDIPTESPFYSEIVRWEAQHWDKKLDDLYYDANVDTTFAMFDVGRNFRPGDTLNSLRIDRPYTARHLPWYTNGLVMTEEGEYYFERCDRAISTWRGGECSGGYLRG